MRAATSATACATPWIAPSRAAGADGGSVRKAIVVGTDIPDLDETHVDAAARLLDHHDVVFDPRGGRRILPPGVRRRDAPAEA